MKVEKFIFSNPIVLEYENIIKSIWKEDFLEDFRGGHINSNDYGIYIAHKDGIVLGGALISESLLVNKYSDPQKTERKILLNKGGYKSLTYLIVKPQEQSKGVATKILKTILPENKNIWLTCENALLPFYKKFPFIIDIPSDETSHTNLLIHKPSN